MGTLDFNLKYFDLAQNKLLEIEETVSPYVELIVVIPAFKEPDIISALESLLITSLRPEQYEIIIVLNHPETASNDSKAQTEQSFLDINQWKQTLENKGIHILVTKQELPAKHAGVGLARKIGMDAAVHRFYTIKKPHGVIMTYDGDCTCTSNHMDKVLEYFTLNPKIEAASIHYEHPFEKVENDLYQQNIIDYELHLRAYIQWKRYIGLPYAYQTIGSCMAVRASSYTRKGGMNKRKAGEDFYFLHKFTHDGRFGEIHTTTVFPSCRVSDRVPFGTGRAMQEVRDSVKEITTYNPSSFLLMQKLINGLTTLYETKTIESLNLDYRLIEFLETVDVSGKLEICFTNSANFESFKKRFFQWMDAFQMMKYLHYMRDHHFPNVLPLASANELLRLAINDEYSSASEALLAMRKLKKNKPRSIEETKP